MHRESDRAATQLASARERFDGESDDYAEARTRLLAEEIDLQRHLDRVAAQRQALPDGPLIKQDYRFRDMNGAEVGLGDMFARHDTLVTYFWMYGPARERPCPMCTNLLGPLNANATDISQRVSLAVIGRSPVERQIAFAQERGWDALSFYQCVEDDYPLDFGGLNPATGGENPVLAVFRKSGRGVHLFWRGEMTKDMAEQGKDPRGVPDIGVVWTVLDLTPEGRGETWYPKLHY